MSHATFVHATCITVLHFKTGQYKMQTADCRLQTADCRLQTGYKMQTRYKMQTADCRLGTKCRLTFETVFFFYIITGRHTIPFPMSYSKLALPGNDIAPLLETKTLSHDFILCSNCVVIHDPCDKTTTNVNKRSVTESCPRKIPPI